MRRTIIRWTIEERAVMFLLGSTAFLSPKRAFPVLEKPGREKPAQLNTYILKNTK